MKPPLITSTLKTVLRAFCSTLLPPPIAAVAFNPCDKNSSVIMGFSGLQISVPVPTPASPAFEATLALSTLGWSKAATISATNSISSAVQSEVFSDRANVHAFPESMATAGNNADLVRPSSLQAFGPRQRRPHSEQATTITLCRDPTLWLPPASWAKFFSCHWEALDR